MLGQCVFCSWYGIRLRRAAYLEGGAALYHAHCVRVATNSPDPADRRRAEQILREEMPRLLRDRFWEVNPPNRTVNPALAVRDLSAGDLEQVCRHSSMGSAAEILASLQASEAAPRPAPEPAAGERLPDPAILSQIGFEDPGAADRRLKEAMRATAAAVAEAGAAPQPALPPARAPRPARPRARRSDVDRAVEMVSRFTAGEMEEFRGRLARLTRVFSLEPVDLLEPLDPTPA